MHTAATCVESKAAQRMQEANVKKWESSRIARSSVASTCTHDAAFVRVGNNMFALKALCQPDMVHACSNHLPCLAIDSFLPSWRLD